jgi:uncharacterized protein (DUF58 family)
MDPRDVLALALFAVVATLLVSALAFALFPPDVAVPSFPSSPPAAPAGAVPVPVPLPFVTELPR